MVPKAYWQTEPWKDRALIAFTDGGVDTANYTSTRATAAVAFGSFTLTAAQDATVGCPCISFPWAGSNQFLNVDTGMLTLTIMDKTGVLSEYPYPTSYGMDVCASHDQLLQPYCADADGVVSTKAPDFCGNKWCFVDPDSCDVTYETSSYFHQFPPILYYSYETCSAENTFVAPLDNISGTASCLNVRSLYIEVNEGNPGRPGRRRRARFGVSSCWTGFCFLLPVSMLYSPTVSTLGRLYCFSMMSSGTGSPASP